MGPIFVLLITFHLIGALLNVRLLASCFKDKMKYVFLQKCRPTIIFQCFLQLILLAFNAYQVKYDFSDHQGKKRCDFIGVFMTSLTFFLIYNLLAIQAIEDLSILGLKRVLTPRQAISAVLIAGILTCGSLLWAGCLFTAGLCTSHLASAAACWLISIILLMSAWKIYSRGAPDTTTIMPQDFEVKDRGTVFWLTGLVFLCALLTLSKFAEAVQIIDMQQWVDLKKMVRLFSINVIWLAVGIVLPVCFQFLIESSADDFEWMKIDPA